MMMQKTQFWQLSIYLCFLMFLMSCTQNVPEFRPDESWMPPGEISETLDAHIYFDATLSMQGFVNLEGPTHYKQMCLDLKSVITVGGWSDEKVKFFKFGEKVEPINDNDYRMVAIPEFYENEDINRQTLIQEVINYETRKVINIKKTPATVEGQAESIKTDTEISENKETDRLVIIVTDLFQDQGDVTPLVAQLKKKYIGKGLEVGLLGFRSQFNGTVYDTGIREVPKSYKSTPRKPETFRPFYLLVLGKYADIANYFDRLIARGFTEVKTVIFSRYLVNPLITFEEAEIGGKKGLNKDTTFAGQTRLLQQYSVQQYAVLSDFDEVEFTATSEYTASPHAMFFDFKELDKDVVAKYAPAEGQTKEIPAARSSLKVEPTFSENESEHALKSKLTVKFSLVPESLPHKKTIYLYEITLKPKVNEYGAPDWCSGWDMGSERDGSKTVNLVNFVRDISQVTAQEHQPEIAKFYFYIKN